MFRVKESDNPRDDSVVVGAVLVTLALALFINVGGAFFALGLYRELSELPSEAVGPLVVDSMRWTSRFLAIFMLVLGCALIVSVAALARLFRHFRTSQQSLRRVKMMAHNILASTDQGVITTDTKGQITSINSAAIRLVGVDFDCVGQPLVCVETAELPLARLCKPIQAGEGSLFDHDFTVQRNGRAQRLWGDAHVLTDTDGRTLGCVIHLRDVTERVLMEERMSRMERFISLGSLAAGLHHEIKNPLTALSIHVQLLEERLRDPAATEPVDEFLGVLKTEIHRLNGVLESFRNFTNLQRLTIQPTNALDVLDDIIRLVRPQAAQQQVRVNLRHPDAMLPLVPLDAEKFGQAVLNLLINSLEAMPDGGLLSLTAAVEDGRLRVHVTDTGPGIAEEVQPSVFKPYFSTKSKGTGMGLALTEKLIGQHGGQIDFQTGPNGTTFRLSLPLEQRDETR